MSIIESMVKGRLQKAPVEKLMEKNHGRDFEPCSCGCSIFNCSPDGELHCASCGSGSLNELGTNDPRLTAAYPLRFYLIVHQGRKRLCEARKAIAMADAERDRRAKSVQGVSDEQRQLDALLERNRAKYRMAIEAKYGKRKSG